MKFVSMMVKNFRNFADIKIDLDNKNVIFGMNDSGKSNLLNALRFVLDREIRSQGFTHSDYHKNDTSQTIEITLELDLSDWVEDNEHANDSKLIISKIAGARNCEESPDSFFIKLEGNYDETELFGNPILSWGSRLDTLIPIPSRGETYDIDKIFRVVYIEPTIDLDKVFKRNKRLLFKEGKKSENDIRTEKEIIQNINDLNTNISSLEIIGKVQTDLTKSYKLYRNEQLEIQLQSEVSISGYMDNLTPYIKWNDDDNYYPTSGDGRKKLLSYALNNIISSQKFDKHILIYLIEEPENSLHRSMQLALSKQLFTQEVYNYFFLTTHSAELLYEMDETQLVRISNLNKGTGFSYHYIVPVEYKYLKKQLNKSLSQSIFYDEVLLVEGGSEYCLFEAVLNWICPDYELLGKYLLQVDGISFSPYVNLYEGLGITFYIKTDNDLKSKKGSKETFDVIGLNRCLTLIGEEKLKPVEIKLEEKLTPKKKKQKINNKKVEIYEQYKDVITKFTEYNIYLSEIDLENDLFKIIPDELKKATGEDDPVSWLQKRKLYNMIEFNENLDENISNKILNGFEVLKKFIQVTASNELKGFVSDDQ